MDANMAEITVKIITVFDVKNKLKKKWRRHTTLYLKIPLREKKGEKKLSERSERSQSKLEICKK